MSRCAHSQIENIINISNADVFWHLIGISAEAHQKIPWYLSRIYIFFFQNKSSVVQIGLVSLPIQNINVIFQHFHLDK